MPIKLATEMIDLDTVKLHPRNPNQGDVGAISELIKQNGWYGTIVVNKRTMHVCAGNHRVLAAQALGMAQLPAYIVDVDEQKELQILLADNQASRVAKTDEEMLVEILEEMSEAGSLDGTGFDFDDLDDLVARLGDAETTPFQPFAGAYAESEEERDARANQGGATKAALGLKEVILVYPIEDFKRFTALVSQVKKEVGLETTAQAVLAALRSEAQ